MNVSQLQRIDRWLGIPGCFVLTLLRQLFKRPLPLQNNISNLLFVKLAEQGSSVLAYPAISAAVQMVGKANVYFIVFDDNRFILDVMAIIPPENVITISFDTFSNLLRTAFSALIRLRRLKLDAAIDMEFFTRGSAMLSLLSGARRRVGFHPFYNAGPYRGDLMTHRLLYNPHLHTAQTFWSMVEALKFDPAHLPTMGLVAKDWEIAPPLFTPLPAERKRAEDLLAKALPNYSRLVLLNPNASDLLPLRRWPTERYMTLAGRLLKEFPDVSIAFTGAPNEAPAAAELARQVNSPRCVSLAGQTTLRELLVLFTVAEALVTNDSGPAHFATLTPIRVVTLFGPETPALYAARSPRNIPLWAELVCSPCINAFNNRQSPCRNNVCMQSISVGQVFNQVALALRKGPGVRLETPVIPLG